MPMNRSPCRLLPPSLMIGALTALAVPPGMTHLQESTAEPPARITPETLRERGVQPGQTDRNVGLHEQMLPISKVHVHREAAGDGGEELITFRADIAICDIINLNWRYYPRSAYEGANAKAVKQMAQGKLTMLLEHPGWEDGWAGRLDSIAARWTSLGIEDREVEWPPESGQTVTKPVVFGEGVFIGTRASEVVRKLLEGGVFVGISTNAYSSVKWTRFGDLNIDDPTGLLDPDMEIPVTGDDLTYLTIDAVALPANSGGQTYAEHAAFAPLPTRQESALPQVTPPDPPAPTPGKELYMHPKIKALCERLGKTLEQIKTENQTEYQQALEDIAGEQNTLATEAARVPGLTAELARVTGERDAANTRADASEAARVAEARTGMVDAAIASTNLPEIAPYQDGETTVDLAGEWRAGLLESAMAAANDADAQALINRQVAARAHLLGPRQNEGAGARPAPRPPTPGPRLPIGDNDAPDPQQESADPSLHGNALIARLRG